MALDDPALGAPPARRPGRLTHRRRRRSSDRQRGRGNGPWNRRPRTFAGLLPLLVLAGAGLGAAACGGGTPVPSDPVLAQGQTIYNNRCAQCHGTNGQGGTGMKLGGGRAAQVFPDIQSEIQVIANGRDGTAMPAWKGVLSPEEINAVARYTRESLPG